MIQQFKVFPSQPTGKALFIGVFALFACVLSACSSAPRSLTYYLLHTTGDSAYTVNKASTAVVIDKITLPEYLKHRGLVYQTSDTNLHISTSHLWAEPVDEGLTKALTSALASKQVSLLRPDHYASEEAIHMALHLNDFVSTYEGEVVLSGQYVITHVKGQTQSYPFLFKTPLEDDGFSPSIKAMRNTIQQLAEDIRKTVTKFRVSCAIILASIMT